MKIGVVLADRYCIPLAEVLSNSTHGEMSTSNSSL